MRSATLFAAIVMATLNVNVSLASSLEAGDSIGKYTIFKCGSKLCVQHDKDILTQNGKRVKMLNTRDGFYTRFTYEGPGIYVMRTYDPNNNFYKEQRNVPVRKK